MNRERRQKHHSPAEQNHSLGEVIDNYVSDDINM